MVSSWEGRFMLVGNAAEHASAMSVATVMLDFRAHPETAGPVR